jgi:glycosyltransferase involved in cell wall biosynthesis
MSVLSVITVNKNNAAGLKKTIESVVSQTYKDFEFIVIDGDSDDGSKELIAEFGQHFHYSLSGNDSGIYQAMNKGIESSGGRYLLFLNSGDWLSHADVIKNIVPHLKGTDVISGDIDIYDRNQWHHMTSEEKLSVSYFLRISLYHQATFISRALFQQYGNYNETFKSTGDYEFFIRTLLKHGASYKHVPVLISNFVADGMSNDPAFRQINMSERDRSWQLNFSPVVLKDIGAFDELAQSKEIKWGRRIINRLPFLKKK